MLLLHYRALLSIEAAAYHQSHYYKICKALGAHT